MTFKFKKIPQYMFVAANLLMIVAMIFCAYSSYLPPQVYPNWSYFGMAFPAFMLANFVFLVFWLVFKPKLALMPIASMAICGWAVRAYCPVNIRDTKPDGCIKVLTYNVMGFNMTEYPQWDANPIVACVLNSGADIVCLQECNGVSGRDSLWASINRKYEFVDVQEEKSTGLALLSRYPIISVERIEYNSESNASFAYEILIGEDTMMVINNHLESFRLTSEDKDNYKSLLEHPKDDAAKERYEGLTSKLAGANAVRGAQADSVAAYVNRCEKKYVMVCGDFNDVPVSYTHHRLTRTLNDAYTRSGNGVGVSYNKSLMYFRIDNMLCSPNIEPYGAKVDDFCKASDHYPLFCYLKLL